MARESHRRRKAVQEDVYTTAPHAGACMFSPPPHICEVPTLRRVRQAEAAQAPGYIVVLPGWGGKSVVVGDSGVEGAEGADGAEAPEG